MIAQRLQNSICRTNNAFPTPQPSSLPLSEGIVPNTVPRKYSRDNVPGNVPDTSGPCAYDRIRDQAAGGLIPSVSVVPETAWNEEDFRNQCAGDPYTESAQNDHSWSASGTLAGVVINGAIVTRDGAFHIITVGGGSEADFGAEVITCNKDTLGPGPPTNGVLWTDLISSGTHTERASLFLPAAAGAYEAALLTAKAGYNQNPIPSTTTTVVTGMKTTTTTIQGQSTNYQQANTSLLIGSALGTFIQGLTSLTLGNPSPALTLRSTFEKWANEFNQHLLVACANATGAHVSQSSQTAGPPEYDAPKISYNSARDASAPLCKYLMITPSPK